jgi:hypothetical protein
VSDFPTAIDAEADDPPESDTNEQAVNDFSTEFRPEGGAPDALGLIGQEEPPPADDLPAARDGFPTDPQV